jgi:hypothetical protein
MSSEERQAMRCEQCEWEATTECERAGGCNVKFLELSKLDTALCLTLAGLITLIVGAIWYLASGIDKIIDLVKR